MEVALAGDSLPPAPPLHRTQRDLHVHNLDLDKVGSRPDMLGIHGRTCHGLAFALPPSVLHQRRTDDVSTHSNVTTAPKARSAGLRWLTEACQGLEEEVFCSYHQHVDDAVEAAQCALQRKVMFFDRFVQGVMMRSSAKKTLWPSVIMQYFPELEDKPAPRLPTLSCALRHARSNPGIEGIMKSRSVVGESWRSQHS